MIEISDPPFPRSCALVVVAEQQPPLELPADTAQRRCCKHAFGRATRSHIHVDRRVRIGRRDHAGHVAVADQHDAAAQRAQLGNQFLMARPIKHTDNDLARFHAFCGGDGCHIFGRCLVQIDNAVGIARAHGQLVHINIGGIEQIAMLGHRQHRECIRPGFRCNRRALERIERDIDLWSCADRRTDFFADIQHRRFVTFALTDDHRAIHIELIERRAHGFDRSMIRRFLVATPDQA